MTFSGIQVVSSICFDGEGSSASSSAVVGNGNVGVKNEVAVQSPAKTTSTMKMAETLLPQKGKPVNSSLLIEEGEDGSASPSMASTGTHTVGVNSIECVICGTSAAFYKCPCCERRTCSAVCCTEHKTRFGCDGRKKTIFGNKKLKEMDSKTLLEDFNFLDKINEEVDRSHRMLLEGKIITQVKKRADRIDAKTKERNEKRLADSQATKDALKDITGTKDGLNISKYDNPSEDKTASTVPMKTDAEIKAEQTKKRKQDNKEREENAKRIRIGSDETGGLSKIKTKIMAITKKPKDSGDDPQSADDPQKLSTDETQTTEVVEISLVDEPVNQMSKKQKQKAKFVYREGLVQEAKLRRTKLLLNPAGCILDMGKNNNSYYDKTTKLIHWKLEWSFFGGEYVEGESPDQFVFNQKKELFQDEPVAEDMTIKSIVERYFGIEPEDDAHEGDVHEGGDSEGKGVPDEKPSETNGEKKESTDSDEQPAKRRKVSSSEGADKIENEVKKTNSFTKTEEAVPLAVNSASGSAMEVEQVDDELSAFFEPFASNYKVYIRDRFPIGNPNLNPKYTYSNQLVEVDINRTLRETLQGREIAEYPRFLVTTPEFQEEWPIFENCRGVDTMDGFKVGDIVLAAREIVYPPIKKKKTRTNSEGEIEELSEDESDNEDDVESDGEDILTPPVSSITDDADKQEEEADKLLSPEELAKAQAERALAKAAKLEAEEAKKKAYRDAIMARRKRKGLRTIVEGCEGKIEELDEEGLWIDWYGADETEFEDLVLLVPDTVKRKKIIAQKPQKKGKDGKGKDGKKGKGKYGKGKDGKDENSNEKGDFQFEKGGQKGKGKKGKFGKKGLGKTDGFVNQNMTGNPNEIAHVLGNQNMAGNPTSDATMPNPFDVVINNTVTQGKQYSNQGKGKTYKNSLDKNHNGNWDKSHNSYGGFRGQGINNSSFGGGNNMASGGKGSVAKHHFQDLGSVQRMGGMGNSNIGKFADTNHGSPNQNVRSGSYLLSGMPNMSLQLGNNQNYSNGMQYGYKNGKGGNMSNGNMQGGNSWDNRMNSMNGGGTWQNESINNQGMMNGGTMRNQNIGNQNTVQSMQQSMIQMQQQMQRMQEQMQNMQGGGW